MRTPVGMAARMAGAIVAVVLTAGPGAAGSGDALPPLLPKAAHEAGIDAIAPPVEGDGSANGGIPAGVVPAGAVPAEPAAEDARTGDTRARGTRAGDEELEPAPTASDSGNMERPEVSPQPASRLLRALAKPSGAELSAPDEGAAGAAPVYAVDGCPRALLRRLLAGAADEGGALTALGIEREVLTLCRERQEIVAALFETEARLRELRAPSEPPVPAASTGADVPAPAPALPQSTAPGRAQPSPLRTRLAARAEKANEADTRAGQGQAQAPVSPAPVSPRYAWFSIIGTPGALRAGITDGTGVWFVREGDALPGGSKVAAIAARPPAVRVSAPGGTAVPGSLVPETDGETLLPYRARPGGGP